MKDLKELTTIYIVRHGETEWNVKGLIQGHTDSPLTSTGEQQARQIAEDLKDIHFDEVFSSDLLRTQRTAEIIVLERKIAIKTTEALRERRYGTFESKPYVLYNEAIKKLFKKYKHLSEEERHTLPLHPSVETIDQSVARFITFLREVAVGFGGKTILVVTSGGVMRYFLIHLGFATYSTLPPGSIGNTSLIKVQSDGVDFFINETKGINKQEEGSK